MDDIVNTFSRSEMTNSFVALVERIYGTAEVPLHRPKFCKEEEHSVAACVRGNFVSSVGKEIEYFEKWIADYVGAGFAVATVNGTSALHLALHSLQVGENDIVLTQALSFVATANAILYTGATPAFIDIERNQLGMCPKSLENFLRSNVYLSDGFAFEKSSGKRIKACIAMHTYGQIGQAEEINELLHKYNILLVEDAAEALGSMSNQKFAGTFGEVGIFSFNGNKLITTGGGGMVVTNNKRLADRVRHLSTTAKVSSTNNFFHDELGFNYRLPNINAVLGLSQAKKIENFISEKRAVAAQYDRFFTNYGIEVLRECSNQRSNFWLSTIIMSSEQERNAFLKETNEAGVMTRPAWSLLPSLPHLCEFPKHDLSVSLELEKKIVNLPSSVP